MIRSCVYLNKFSLSKFEQYLSSTIKFNGPIPVYQFMRECLTNPFGGYYTKANHLNNLSSNEHNEENLKQPVNPIGSSGDFITSPEISPLFGESIGIWFVSMWEQFMENPAIGTRFRKPDYSIPDSFIPFRLIELGPGKGTLLHNVLETLHQFHTIPQTIDSIHLVEPSPLMRNDQLKILGCLDPQYIPISHSQLDSLPTSIDTFDIPKALQDQCLVSATVLNKEGTKIPVFWCNSIFEIPGFGSPPVSQKREQKHIHESYFPLDMIPNSQKTRINNKPVDFMQKSQFSPSKNENITNPISESETLSFETNSIHSLNSKIDNSEKYPFKDFIIAHEFFDALPVHQFRKTDDRGWVETLVSFDPEKEQFHFTLSPQSTPASRHLVPQLEPFLQDKENQIEFCPEAQSLVDICAQRLSKFGGSMLVIDYGDDKIYQNSLVAIQNHKALPSPLENLGEADLSCWVDFSLLTRSGSKHENVKVYGSTPQGSFLVRLGIIQRMNIVLSNIDKSIQSKAEKAKLRRNHIAAVKRLIDFDEMGASYKVWAMVGRNTTEPFGFSDNV